jgi:cell division protein FtsZ
MGTGSGSGENRALEAAQQAISSPLLDNVSINGASGVLINILGGEDLTLGEATQISEIIHDAVGDDAQIIFGAGNDPKLTGEVRVTVIATGFDRAVTGEPVVERGAAQVLPFRRQSQAPAAPAATPAPPEASPQATKPFTRPATPASGRPAASPDVSDMEIPTFIRRQMD